MPLASAPVARATMLRVAKHRTGFDLVIAACRGFLEHGIDLGPIADKHAQ
jgi:hypothetical protein